MSDFMESEAEESGEELKSDSEEEEEEDEEDEQQGNIDDIINDDEEEAEEPQEGSDSDGKESDTPRNKERDRKRRKDDLDEEDLELIEENTGLRLERKKFRRVKMKAFDSDEDDDQEHPAGERDRDHLANQLFSKEDGELMDPGMVGGEMAPQADDTYAALDESESDDDDVDDFIVDDAGQPIKRNKQKRHRVYAGPEDQALQEAQNIFGLDFDFEEFDKYGQDEYDEEGEEEYVDDEYEGERPRKKSKKGPKKSIYEVFEPSELEKVHLTDRDNEIRIMDTPERFQVRLIPVKIPEEGELEEEAEWIYKHAFLALPISQQQVKNEFNEPARHTPKPPSAIHKIREALKLMRIEQFEVPFISTYRKEYVEPELSVYDLWKVWEWDEKWTQLHTRKLNMKKLFEQMQSYQYDKAEGFGETVLPEDYRGLEKEDIERLLQVQSMEELRDVYGHFMLYYGHEIQAMRESLKKKKEQETREEGEAEDEPEEPKKAKMPKRRDLYSICRQAGLTGLAKKFGLSPEQFGENLRDNYQRHETEQFPIDPTEVAEEFMTNTFPTVDAVLEGARHMVAVQISRDPLVRQVARMAYYERAKLTIKPTKKGKKEIDSFHACSSFKYTKDKPVRDLKGEQFLQMHQAEEEGLLTISINIDLKRGSGYQTYFDEIKQLFYRDEFSNLVQEWNDQRSKALQRAFTQMLYPFLEKELKGKLLQEAKDYIIMQCRLKLRSWIEIAPYQADHHPDDEDYHDGFLSHGLRVLSCAFEPSRDTASFFAMLDGDGQVTEFLRLNYLLIRRNAAKAKEKEQKDRDLEKFKDFVLKNRPHVVVVTASCRESQTVVEDIKYALVELEQENQMAPINVELVDPQVATIFQNSPRSETEFREYPPLLRHAVSLGRRIQDPLAELAALCQEEGELLCLKIAPMQDQVDQDILLQNLTMEFVTVTNEVGVDPNRILEHPHFAPLIQFVCGLGPRKGQALLKALRQKGGVLENRSQLVTECGMGPKVFLNSSGFIKLDSAAIQDITTYVEVLSGTRIHPETYEWAKKMAVDALEYDETAEDANPSAALEEILEAPEKLRDLDLDAFAEELERQGFGNKRTTLYDIRDELFSRFKDRRRPYRPLSMEEKFKLLTTENEESMYVGRMVICGVVGFAYRKPSREALDQANPVRNDDTHMWQCPFCLKDTFPDLSEVWTHFDDGSCPGQAIGVRTRLENGMTGFIHTKNISDKRISTPEERVKVGMNLHCRVLKVNMEKYQVDLTCRSSDLADKEGKFSLPKDLYYDHDMADKDKKEEENAKKKANRPTYIKRVIVHPSFHNISFKEAEKVLAEMEQGECIIRPSSKGSDHLTATWKVDDGIYQHIDIREEGKENVFSLGKSLWVENDEFEDLDEIIARHIQPMAMFAREIMTYKYYRSADGGNKSKLEELLITDKRKAPQKIPYFISASKEFPGKFLLGYMPRHKPRIEFVTITPEGFRYRSRVHGSLNGLFKWFKEHFRDAIPGTTPRHRTPLAMSESSTPYTPGGATPTLNDINPHQLLQQAFPGGISNPSMYNTMQSNVSQQQSRQSFNNWGSGSSQTSQTSSSQSNQTQNASYMQQQFPQYGYYQTQQSYQT